MGMMQRTFRSWRRPWWQWRAIADRRDRLGGGAAVEFSPLDLTPTAWYDASDLSTLFQDAAGTTPVTVDGDVVGLIQDKSGNGNDMTQGTTANKPLYKTDGTLHWLQYDSVNDFLQNTLFPFPVLWTLTAGALTTSVAAATKQILNADGSVNPRCLQWRRNGGTMDVVAFNTTPTNYVDATGTLSASAAFVASALRDTASVEARFNGVSSGSPTATLGTPNSGTRKVVFGAEADATPGGESWSGNIYGLVMVPSVLAGADLTNLETWMAAKSGVTL